MKNETLDELIERMAQACAEEARKQSDNDNDDEIDLLDKYHRKTFYTIESKEER